MPKSKTRKKKKGQPGYVPPEKRKKPPPSPRWYPFLFLGLMAAGVLIIVLNYMALIPGTDQTQPVFLWVGLGLIASGFLVATKYR